VRIFQIAKQDGSFRGFNTVGQLASVKSFGTEVALFYHSFGTSWVVGAYLIKKMARVKEIETPRTIGASRHTKPAPYATMIIHLDYAVVSLKGCLGRAKTHTHGTLAVIAQNRKHELLMATGQVGSAHLGKAMLKAVLPDPLDLDFWIVYEGNVMVFMACAGNPFKIYGFV